MARERKPEKTKMQRRTYLKSLGGGIAGTTAVAGVGSASGRPDEWDRHMRVYHRGRRVLKRTDSVAKFREFLRNHGFNFGTKDVTYNVTKPTSDGVSTQYLDEADLQIWLTISQPNCSDYPYRYTGELTFDWSRQDADDWGELPDDAIGMTFSDRHFWIPDLNGDEYWTDSYISYSNQGTNGIGFGVDDSQADTAGKLSAGAQIRWNQATDETANQRFVYGQYEHTYDGDWGSIGFNVGDITLSWSGGSGGSWDTNQDHNDVPLKVSAADADCILY